MEWTRVTDELGRVYYWCEKSNQTSWQVPTRVCASVCLDQEIVRLKLLPLKEKTLVERLWRQAVAATPSRRNVLEVTLSRMAMLLNSERMGRAFYQWSVLPCSTIAMLMRAHKIVEGLSALHLESTASSWDRQVLVGVIGSLQETLAKVERERDELIRTVVELKLQLAEVASVRL